MLLLASWVLLGLVGHDPWKTEDATAFGVAWGMMNGGSVLAPSLAGEPYVGRPPLVHALAALAGTALAPPLRTARRRAARDRGAAGADAAVLVAGDAPSSAAARCAGCRC